MARLPTSGQLSLNNVRTTFSLTGALPMNTLYKGIGIVPNTPQHSAVPASGAITMSNLYGADIEAHSMTPTNQTLDEGGANDGADPSSQLFTVTSTGFSGDTTGTLYWTIGDSAAGGTAATTADFSAVSGSFTSTDNTGTFTVTVNADTTTEGDETWYVHVRTGSIAGTVVDSSAIIVKDTSIAASYGLTGPASIAEDGSTNNYAISAPGVPDATAVYWTIGTTAAGGTAATTADFDAVSGSTTITTNAGTIPIVAKADTFTEGVETWFLQLRTGSTSGTIVANRSFTVTDDSLSAATYAIGGLATIAENDTPQAYPITTTNVADGTTLYWTVNTTTADMTAVSGSFVVNSNAGTFNLTAIADNLTEGSENITLSVRTGSVSGTVVATKAITITDDSLDLVPTYNLTGSATIAEDGIAETYTVATTNITDGTTLYWTINGTTADFNAVSGSFSVTSNSGTFGITAKADTTTEGSENFTISVRTGSTAGTVVDTLAVTVTDDSIAAATSTVDLTNLTTSGISNGYQQYDFKIDGTLRYSEPNDDGSPNVTELGRWIPLGESTSNYSISTVTSNPSVAVSGNTNVITINVGSLVTEKRIKLEWTSGFVSPGEATLDFTLTFTNNVTNAVEQKTITLGVRHYTPDTGGGGS